VGEFEPGNVSPSLDVVEKLTRGLQVDILVLIGDEASRLAVPQVRAEVLQALDRMDEVQQRALLRTVRLMVRH
jgi:hypothetical protein